ncbi:MAG: hypothetical protein RI967_595 [Planctomycetota bacterium]
MSGGEARSPSPRDDALERAADFALFGAGDGHGPHGLPTGSEAAGIGGSVGGAPSWSAREIESFEHAIALLATDDALARSAGARAAEAPPAALVARLHELAAAMHDEPRTRPTRPARRPTHPTPAPSAAPDPLPLAFPAPRAPRRDWLVAAASIAFGAAATWALLDAGRTREQPTATDPAAFLTAHPTAVHWPWTPTADEHVVAPVSGEAYFDPSTGDGLLVIDGLAPNDPNAEQYQLWIFDERRDERYPVDGGVFDVPASGHAVVPIHAKLAVARPTLFAVTVERPGGVVVSERRIALVARP